MIKKRSFDTAGEQTLKRTAASFVLTMQTGVGFVRSLYDNENHYRITWGFRTWEQQGGEGGGATLGLINGLWRCPSGPRSAFFFLLFYPLVVQFTTTLSFPSSVRWCEKGRKKEWKINRVQPDSPLSRRKEAAEVFMSQSRVCDRLVLPPPGQKENQWPLTLETRLYILECVSCRG